MARLGSRRAASAIAVDVTDRQRTLRLGPRWLTGIVRRSLAREGIAAAEIGILLVNDRGIAALHERWLDVPGPTDVITFDLADGDDPDHLQGDIVVSTETAARTARALGWNPRHEAAYYVIHGLLHLAGYDDHDAADRRAMRARERVLLAACGLPAPPRTAAEPPRRGRRR